jgi:hypothetical protein
MSAIHDIIVRTLKERAPMPLSPVSQSHSRLLAILLEAGSFGVTATVGELMERGGCELGVVLAFLKELGEAGRIEIHAEPNVEWVPVSELQP